MKTVAYIYIFFFCSRHIHPDLQQSIIPLPPPALPSAPVALSSPILPHSLQSVGGIEACKLAQSAGRVIWIPILALQCAMNDSPVISPPFHHSLCRFLSFGLPSPPLITPSYSNYQLSLCAFLSSSLPPPIFVSSHTYTFFFSAPFLSHQAFVICLSFQVPYLTIFSLLVLSSSPMPCTLLVMPIIRLFHCLSGVVYL